MNLHRWLADARALGSPNLVAVIVGNKSDRDEDREVEWAEASRWAAENGLSCFGSRPTSTLINLHPRTQTYIMSRHHHSQARMWNLHSFSLLGPSF